MQALKGPATSQISIPPRTEPQATVGEVRNSVAVGLDLPAQRQAMPVADCRQASCGVSDDHNELCANIEILGSRGCAEEKKGGLTL